MLLHLYSNQSAVTEAVPEFGVLGGKFCLQSFGINQKHISGKDKNKLRFCRPMHLILIKNTKNYLHKANSDERWAKKHLTVKYR